VTESGLVVVDKPPGMTSHDVVARVRRTAGTRKVGHAGTLDPMATGVLVLGLNRATRLLGHLMLTEKTYEATVRLGAATSTDDAEGEITATRSAFAVTEDDVREVLREFEGDILQVPSTVSAIKVAGKRAYQRARSGEEVELAARPVTIHAIEAGSFRREGDFLDLELRVSCSSGTYIRSIAHEMGQRLGCGALLSALRRIEVGEFALDRARTMEEIRELAGLDRLAEVVIPLADLLTDMPAAYFDAAAETRIRAGNDFRTSPFVVPPGAPLVKALSHSGELIAIGELKIPNLYHPGTVL